MQLSLVLLMNIVIDFLRYLETITFFNFYVQMLSEENMYLCTFFEYLLTIEKIGNSCNCIYAQRYDILNPYYRQFNLIKRWICAFLCGLRSQSPLVRNVLRSSREADRRRREAKGAWISPVVDSIYHNTNTMTDISHLQMDGRN